MLQKVKKQAVLSETKRVGKFGIVGIINTLLDFGIYNLMIQAFSLAAIPANFVSTSFAMTFSFIANKRFVFDKKTGSILKQALLFLIVTAFGLYVIQNAAIYGLTVLWLWPLQAANGLIEFFGMGGVFSQEFVINNGAKAFATALSLVWNYLLYRRFVFKK